MPPELNLPTIRKTRILARSQQIVRADWDNYIDDSFCDISRELLSVLPTLDINVPRFIRLRKGMVSEGGSSVY